MFYAAYLPSHVHFLSYTALLGIVFQTPFTLSVEKALTCMLDERFYYLSVQMPFLQTFNV